MNALTLAEPAPQAVDVVYAETWAIVEMHFLTRPYLMAEARRELAECFDRLMADGRTEPRILKNLACRTIQLKYGPAPANDP